jgi:hypothetical protein
MKTTVKIKQIVTATGFAVAVMFGAPVATHYINVSNLDMISQAHAEDDGGYKQKGKPAGKGSAGHKGGAGNDAGKGSKDVILKGKGDENSDPLSDRPAWAGAKGGKAGAGGKPGTSGSKKGDLYGDLYVLIRSPITGAAETEIIGGVVYPKVQAYDASGTLLVGVWIPRDPATGDLMLYVTPAGVPTSEDLGNTQAYWTSEVDFGRLSVARAPTKVLTHALDEAVSKLKTTGAVLSLDAAGRLVITVGGISTTIDSPLENLALYQDYIADGVIAGVTLPTGFSPVALLAAAADKYGVVTLDTVMYLDSILKVSPDLSLFTYSRTDAYTGKTVDILQLKPGSTTEYIVVNVSLMGSVDWTIPTGAVPSTGAAAFAQAVDDAVQVIEFIHDFALD